MIGMREGTSSPSWATSYGADGVLATRSAARAHDDGPRVWPHVATVKKLAKRVRRVWDAFEKESTLSPTCTSPPTTLTTTSNEQHKKTDCEDSGSSKANFKSLFSKEYLKVAPKAPKGKCRFQLSPNWLDRMCGLEEGVRPNFRPSPRAWRASRLLRR